MRERGGERSDGVLLIVSIDTEEDNWYRSRQGVTCENIGELRRQAAFFDRLGVRPTYFTSYQVAIDPEAAEIIRDVGSRGEIAAHLHPWNTPPLSEAFTPRNSMLKNLSAELQLAKLQSLTATLEQTLGIRPRAFRAGRYGLGRDTVGALLRCGYQVDSSVTPFVSWEEVDDGPTFIGAPLDVYRLAPDQDVSQPAEDGAVIEVPLSCGFGRRSFALWGRVDRALDRPGLRRLRSLCKRIVLSPELAAVADMLTLSRRLLEHGVRHLHLSWHSPSLKPGLSPFTATVADVDRLYATVDRYIERLSQITPLTFVTVSEAAAALAERAQPEAARC
jgi:hypothetical protein